MAVVVWSLLERTLEAFLHGHYGMISSVAITSDWKYIVSWGGIIL